MNRTRIVAGTAAGALLLTGLRTAATISARAETRDQPTPPDTASPLNAHCATRSPVHLSRVLGALATIGRDATTPDAFGADRVAWDGAPSRVPALVVGAGTAAIRPCLAIRQPGPAGHAPNTGTAGREPLR